jgi:DNA-directed RNA polymerase subunit RPC12/RpoP
MRDPYEHDHPKKQIHFDCGHTTYYQYPYPKVREMLWCIRCRKEVRVTLSEFEYKIRCQSCRYSRPFGRARVNAEIAASKHRMRHPTHVVHLYNGGEFLRSFPARPTDTGADRDQTVMF